MSNKYWNFNRAELLENFPFASKDPNLKAEQVWAYDILLSFIEKDNRWQCLEQIAYFLATVAHECSYKRGKEMFVSMAPIKEKGSAAYFEKRYGKDSAVGKRMHNSDPLDGAKYCGRGYVQLTGKRNYANHGLVGQCIADEDIANACDAAKVAFEFIVRNVRTGRQVHIDRNTLVWFPDLIMIPRLSYQDSVARMMYGGYTGAALSKYINLSKVDYVDARSVINGDVKRNGEKIAQHARIFEDQLRKSLIKENEMAGNPPIEYVEQETIVASNMPDTVPITPEPVVKTSDSPVGDTPDVPPVKVQDESNTEKIMGYIVAFITGFGALLADKPILAISAAIIFAALLLGATWLQRERLKIAADPNKYNVR